MHGPGHYTIPIVVDGALQILDARAAVPNPFPEMHNERAAEVVSEVAKPGWKVPSTSTGDGVVPSPSTSVPGHGVV